jgi:hypothetical protein
VQNVVNRLRLMRVQLFNPARPERLHEARVEGGRKWREASGDRRQTADGGHGQVRRIRTLWEISRDVPRDKAAQRGVECVVVDDTNRGEHGEAS